MEVQMLEGNNESVKVKGHRSKKKIALVTVVCVITAFFLIVMPVLTVIIYNDNFGGRFETAEWLAWSVSDFEGLEVEECTFPSNKGQLLAGYKYSKPEQEVRGVVVISHGFGGGGHNNYMPIVDYFASNGYLAFGYDATACDKSEGDAVGGLPQGVIDLDYALDYVKQVDEYRDLPIVLFGHSWGGYSIANVLNCHPDVSAEVIVAGFDRSADLVEQWGESMVGKVAIKLFMPYARLYEKLKFGEYATYSALDGFANSDAGVMVLASKDDKVVLPENGYDRFYAEYGDSQRFRFIEFEDRGHNNLYCTEESERYWEQVDEEYAAYVEANGGEDSDEILSEFMKEHFDKSKCCELDSDLMSQIIEFCDLYCK